MAALLAVAVPASRADLLTLESALLAVVGTAALAILALPSELLAARGVFRPSRMPLLSAAPTLSAMAVVPVLTLAESTTAALTLWSLTLAPVAIAAAVASGFVRVAARSTLAVARVSFLSSMPVHSDPPCR
jgi:hypothetical protein